MSALNKERARHYLKQFDFESLFIEELGWDYYDARQTIMVDEESFLLTAVAQKRGFVVLRCETADIPPYATRRKIERQIAKVHQEHLVIYVNDAQEQQVWQWVRREPGRPLASREQTFYAGQRGEPILQKLVQIAFTIDEEDDLTLVDVTSRVRAAFDVERATKKFYDQFKKERSAFEKFLQGIPDLDMGKWYVSVMLNRLMFIYFIQKKGFLDGDTDYLRNRLRLMQQRYGEDQFYSFYRTFLLRLFHEGLGLPTGDHNPDLEPLVGHVPYLNGGIFQEHQVEQKYPDIQIADEAFTRIFDFFDQYQWHLDDQPLRDDKEINPDVLGYIFEKYINQKQMGAYYTKEDITEYISKNTIIPYLFDQARKGCAVAFEGSNSVWSLAQADPDRYIYPAVRHGTDLLLPSEIAVGIEHVPQRGQWNTPTPDEYGLPTEIWRETVARRQRYEEVRDRLAGGEVQDINNFITYNLDIQQFAQDVLENSEGSELLRAFWRAINQVSVLDPTCGSGAFLFAALNILEPLYEACLERMRAFVAELEPEDPPHKYSDFKKILAQVNQQPNEAYYVLKSIVVNNLYGVDIMPEAVEIARLRLFLKLVSQVERVEDVEPLPDIDFNIRTGNTLVGFTTKDEVRQAMQLKQVGSGAQQGKLMFGEDEEALTTIETKAAGVDRLFTVFRQMQTGEGEVPFDAANFAATKQQLTNELSKLEEELNRLLARQYGVDPENEKAYQKWLSSHQPFHWFTEFYGILKQGGFDVIVGNPPYVEYYKVRKEYQIPPGIYYAEKSTNLFAYVMERSLILLRVAGRQGLIVPVSLVCTQRMGDVQTILLSHAHTWHSHYAERPSKLFSGAEVLLTISILDKNKNDDNESRHWSTGLRKWYSNARSELFSTTFYTHLEYRPQKYILPKITEEIENSIMRKLWSSPQMLEVFLRDQTKYRIYYRIGGGRYWKIFTTFQPRFILNGKQTASSRENYLYFSSKEDREIALAGLSSNLFFWYFTLTTNGRDMNPSDLKQFPLNIASMSSESKHQLVQLSEQLMLDYHENKRQKQKKSRRTGHILYEEFYPRLSKHIIDEIDRVLAQHYGFTDEELDFIINYDIKYRMGDDLFDSED
jgi:hypothetical protein